MPGPEVDVRARGGCQMPGAGCQGGNSDEDSPTVLFQAVYRSHIVGGYLNDTNKLEDLLVCSFLSLLYSKLSSVFL